MCHDTVMSRTLSTSVIHRDVIHAHGHSGSNQKRAVVLSVVISPAYLSSSPFRLSGGWRARIITDDARRPRYEQDFRGAGKAAAPARVVVVWLCRAEPVVWPCRAEPAGKSNDDRGRVAVAFGRAAVPARNGGADRARAAAVWPCPAVLLRVVAADRTPPGVEPASAVAAPPDFDTPVLESRMGAEAEQEGPTADRPTTSGREPGALGEGPCEVMTTAAG